MRRRITLSMVRLSSAVSDRDYGAVVQRRGVFGRRIKQVPATGHPSRFEETAIPSPSASSGFVDPRNIVAPLVAPTRVERSVPLKALVAQINYNLFDIELGQQQSQFAYLQAKDLADTVDGVLRYTECCSLERQRYQSELAYYAAVFRCSVRYRGAEILRRSAPSHCRRLQVDGGVVCRLSYGVRYTGDLMPNPFCWFGRCEMKSEFNVVLNTEGVAAELSGEDAFSASGPSIVIFR